MYRSFSSAIFAGLIGWEGRYLLIICNSKLCNSCVFNEVTCGCFVEMMEVTFQYWWRRVINTFKILLRYLRTY